jgi:hypothetical protein
MGRQRGIECSVCASFTSFNEFQSTVFETHIGPQADPLSEERASQGGRLAGDAVHCWSSGVVPVDRCNAREPDRDRVASAECGTQAARQNAPRRFSSTHGDAPNPGPVPAARPSWDQRCGVPPPARAPAEAARPGPAPRPSAVSAAAERRPGAAMAQGRG